MTLRRTRADQEIEETAYRAWCAGVSAQSTDPDTAQKEPLAAVAGLLLALTFAPWSWCALFALAWLGRAVGRWLP